MSLVPWRMVSAVSLCVLMRSLAAAGGTYDELTPEDLSLLYQEYNNIEGGPPPAHQEDESGLRSFLLYQWLSNKQDNSPDRLARPKWVSPDTGLLPPETFDLSLLKGSMMKRVSEASGVFPEVRNDVKQLVQKWKIKKGKSGSQMICYFKLCAFRPPS